MKKQHQQQQQLLQQKQKQAYAALASISDGEAERRLRPVMDALFAFNHKHALKLVQQALQKRPGWPAVRALRACVFLQQHRWEQAHAEIADVRHQLDAGLVPATEDAAKKLYMYYQEIRREDLAAQVYEDVWKKTNGSDVRLAETAYTLYVRGGAFSSAQKLATRLHRIASSRTQRYVFWATAALWLGVTYQARSVSLPSDNDNSKEDDNNSAKSGTVTGSASSQMDQRMLKLGCAMMSKALAASPMAPSAEIVRFATRVFKQAGEFDAAVQLVSHPRLVMDETEMLHVRAELAFASSKEMADYRTLLVEHAPNDWGYWIRYFECLKANRGDEWIDDAQDLIDTVITLQAERPAGAQRKEPLRGIQLAQLELLYRRHDWNGLADAVVTYFDAFGSKSVVSRDLRPWLCILQANGKLHNAVLDRLDTISTERGFPYHLHLAWLKLWFDHLDETPEQLVSRYVEQRLPGLEATDRQPGDDYIILAAHKLLPLSSPPPSEGVPACVEGQGETYDNDRYNDASAVIKAIVLVEAALTWSPCNYDFKLLLLRLYDAVGGVDKMSSVWTSMSVRHIQLSTLTHIVLRPYLECGHHQPLQSLMESMETLWREIDREIPDCTTRAFQDGSLNAAVDFVLFKLRLERSIILAEAMVTEAQVEVLFTGGESLGVCRALRVLSVQPKFTVNGLDGSKRMLSNEDVACFRFWNYAHYDKDKRFETLDDDFIEEGVACDPARLATLRTNLASLTALLQLTERNGNDGQLPSVPVASQPSAAQPPQPDTDRVNITHVPELSSLVSDAVMQACDDNMVTREAALRARIARNLVDVYSLLRHTISAEKKQVNGSRSGQGLANGSSAEQVDVSERIKVLLHDARELIRQLGRLCKEAVGDEDNNADDKEDKKDTKSQQQDRTINFPRRLRECCRVAFDILLLVGIAVSSFSPVLSKGMRKVRKEKTKSVANGGQSHQKGSLGMSAQCFEKVRSIVLMYRDEILAATVRFQEWVTMGIDDGVNWAEHVFQDGVTHQVSDLIPDSMCEAPHSIGNGTAKTDRNAAKAPAGEKAKGIVRTDLCKEIGDSIRSSQSVSCSALLESLTSVTRRLQLADL